MISDGSMPPMPTQQQKMLTADVDGDWYEIEPAKQRQLGVKGWVWVVSFKVV
jgi:hypothetical protein